MEWLAFVVLAALVSPSLEHPTVAGSCDSPRSGRHSYPQNGDGGYTLSVEHTGDNVDLSMECVCGSVL